MKENTKNQTTDNSVEEYRDSAENKFIKQFCIAEGTAGLLAHAACEEDLKNISESTIASAIYSIQDSIGEMNKQFYRIMDEYSAYKLNHQNTIPVKPLSVVDNTVTNINDDEDTSPNIKKHDPEIEFNHQHIIAEGAAGALYAASISPTGSMDNNVVNSATSAIESALREMNKCFQAQLEQGGA